MPVRMTDDPQDQEEYHDSGGGGGRGGFPGGGGGNLLGLLPLLFGLFRSKTGIIVLLLGVAAWYFLGQKGCGGMMQSVSQFALGGNLDPREFAKAPVYESQE